MADIASLQVVVGADISQLESGLGRANQQVSTFGKAMQSAFTGVGVAVGMKAFDVITDGFKAAGDAAIGFNSNLEQSTIAFTSMLGSAEKAQAFLAEMKEFAATTPFEFPDLLQASKQMMAFGFAAGEVKPLLTAVGSAASAMGTGRSGVDSITKALGQMRAATVVQAGELNQLTEQGVPAFQILADAMGISTGEVKKLASEGKIASDVFITAFQAWAKNNYGDMMAKQALTFEGAISTIKDSLQFAVADAFRPFFDVISAGAVEIAGFVQSDTFATWAKETASTVKAAFQTIADAGRTVAQVFNDDWLPSDEIDPFVNAIGQAATVVRDFSRWVAELPEPVKMAGLAFVGVVAAAGPLSAVLGVVTSAVGVVAAALGFLLSPLGLVALAVAALAAAWTVNLGGIQEKTAEFVEIVGRYFDGFVILVQQALTGEVGAAFENLLTMVGMMAGELAPLLAAWGEEFLTWIVVAGPPMLAEVARLGADLLAWIGDQIQPIIAQLLLWGMEFVAWVAPQIPPLLAELGRLYIALYQWVIDQVPGITAELVKWGLLFGAWVLGVAIPELIKALPGIITTLAEWAGTASVEITKLMLNLGVAIATGIVDGFLQAWPTIKQKITEAIGSIQLPSWMGGGGSGMTSLSNRTGGSSGNALWDQIAREEGVDPGLLASLIQQESGGNQGARSSAGAIGLTQLMPGTAAGMGIDPYDPEQNVRGGARYLRQMLDKFGDEERALIAYNAGPGGGAPGESRAYAQRVLAGRVAVPNAGMGDIRISQAQWGATAGMTPQEAAAACGPYAAYLFAQATGRTPNPAEAEQLARAAGWTEAGMGGTGNFMRLLGMQGVNAVRMGTSGMSNADITSMAANAGPMTGFSTPGHYFASTGFDPSSGKFNVGATGTFAGGETWMTVAEMAALMGPIQDIITLGGQMGASFVTGGKQVTDGVGVMGPATTAAAGEVTAAFGTMATGVAGQTQATLTSVTDLGGAMMTTTQDSAGSVITTIADMSGNVTSQYATLANGVSLTMGDMSAGVLTSTTDLGTGIMTTVQDMSGNYITTITDLQGNVTSQYTTLAASATAATAEMGDGVTAEVAAMSAETLTSVTDMGTGTLTITQNAAGEMVATITDMAGNVTSQYTTMGSDVTGSVQDMAGTVVEQIGEVASGFEEANSPIEGFQEALDSVEPPDFGDIVDELNDVRKAAEKAAEAIEEIGTGDNDSSNRDKWWDDDRAAGGPVSAGKTYLVGERGPELFSPFSNGAIIPNHRLGGGGGDTYVVSVNVGSLLANRRDIEEAVIVGLESAQRRGRI